MTNYEKKKNKKQNWTDMFPKESRNIEEKLFKKMKVLDYFLHPQSLSTKNGGLLYYLLLLDQREKVF